MTTLKPCAQGRQQILMLLIQNGNILLGSSTENRLNKAKKDKEQWQDQTKQRGRFLREHRTSRIQHILQFVGLSRASTKRLRNKPILGSSSHLNNNHKKNYFHQYQSSLLHSQRKTNLQQLQEVDKQFVQW